MNRSIFYSFAVTLAVLGSGIRPAGATPGAGDDRDTVITSDGETYRASELTDDLPTVVLPSDGRPLAADLSGRSPGGAGPLDLAQGLGGNSPDTIIGSDGRTQVTTTTSTPYKWIARLVFQWVPGGPYYSCTGWFIGADTVMTAGHCVYDTGLNTWAETGTFTVVPAQNGSTKPYGTFYVKTLYSVTGWTSSENSNYDYGAVKLTTDAPVGHMGFYWTSDSVKGQDETLTGYPGDKPSGTMWKDGNEITKSGTYVLQYENDTYNGQSGSPVYHKIDGVCCYGMAIHVRGGDTYNEGTRIREAVFNNMQTWIDK